MGLFDVITIPDDKEQYRIAPDNRTNERLAIFVIDPDGDPVGFIPPSENRYDQILRVKFGLNQDSFEALRRDKLSSWKITEVILYPEAISIRHENAYEKPVLDLGGTRIHHGVRAEQAFTETIPYENITDNKTVLSIQLVDDKNEVKKEWITTVSKGMATVTKIPDNASFKTKRKIRLSHP
ncbi:hypothetical protein IKG20_01250 [Candidatus Saccharibacteria bacterium]|nr:hypothetical protein [Candidatus Saccharibacteria bacterium]